MSIVDRKLSSDSKQLRDLLRKARLHLATVPTFIFILSSILSFSSAFVINDFIPAIFGVISGLLISQLYWGFMSVKWRIEAYRFNYCFTLYREALKEQLIYPANHFMNKLLIGHPKDVKAIRNLDNYLLKYKRLPKLENSTGENNYRSLAFRIAS